MLHITVPTVKERMGKLQERKKRVLIRTGGVNSHPVTSGSFSPNMDLLRL